MARLGQNPDPRLFRGKREGCQEVGPRAVFLGDPGLVLRPPAKMSITASGLRGRFLGSQSPALLAFLGSGLFLFGTQLCCEDLRHGSGQATAPAVAKGPVSCLPRNVLSERERRKRISLSCERLRALLPQFDGRREDMASVLEMSVQFLRLASALVPGWEKHAVLVSSKETWHTWQKDVLQLALASQTPAGAPDPGVGTSSVTMQQATPSRAAVDVDDGKAPVGAAAVLGGPPALPGEQPPSLVLRSPGLSPSRALRPPLLWSPRSRQTPSPLVSEDSESCLGRTGSPALPELCLDPLPGKFLPLTSSVSAWMAQAAGPVLEQPDSAVSVSGYDVEDGSSFLLTASPDWWLGSLEGRGSSAPFRVPARSSLLDRAEPGFLGDHEPGSQDPPDGPLEPWSSDVSCPSSALREEVDSIFPDFFAY
ncbi:PREDICTED: spermatogenesis- and oogenesis-specific basic helix-loop-helix-containing protein 1 [Lipotes vexillifer]|uniref:Spermatogenesis- and oogenesis-specific basic helix-loop-helix-containing protein 1 n=1 Tax=Lipotes vexillifer TaxID=118797 RepID=A0A340XG83_LIPVE|nr:PREDICTED: spermatogenesis- and oogenesis-specific basic helix-loop-helix-containing protein 1 [Lipotes vexillifer]